MRKSSILGVLVAATLMSGDLTRMANAATGALPEAAAVTTELGANTSAVTYWVHGADGWNVVTTIDTVTLDGAFADQTRHAIVRFAARLLPGQEQVISVPEAVGAPSRELRIRRLGDEIEVATVDVSARS